MVGVTRRKESAVLIWGFAAVAPTQAVPVGFKADCSGSRAGGAHPDLPVASMCASQCCKASHGLLHLLSSVHFKCFVFESVNTVHVYI